MRGTSATAKAQLIRGAKRMAASRAGCSAPARAGMDGTAEANAQLPPRSSVGGRVTRILCILDGDHAWSFQWEDGSVAELMRHLGEALAADRVPYTVAAA